MPSWPRARKALAGEITMQFEALKVGELARRTGLTVRALHHYDAIGLLRPSLHTEAGYRLYTAGDITRLQQVLSLRQLGFSLDEVRACLDRPVFSPLECIRLHIGRLREQVEMQRELCEKLEAIATHFRAAEEVSADEFLRVIERMTMIENYYTPEQLETIKKRGEQMGEEAIRQSQVDWAELIAQVRAEQEKGTDPEGPKVQALARRWMDLVNGFTGGDPGIAESLNRLWEEQGDHIVAQHKMENDPRDLSEYIDQAM